MKLIQLRHPVGNRTLMRQFNLSIPTPCHESWEQMTPAEKGRFCGSCQKTVIDFTNMSDRELAAFFKKPVGSVCGRFHQDQLNREITVPKKRIPWLRYFFHIAWPAFILMLKSCGPKDRVMGKEDTTLAVNSGSAKTDPYEDIIVGALKVPDSLYVDTVEILPDVSGAVVAVDIIDEPDTLKGDIVVDPVGPKHDKDSMVYALSIEQADTSFVTLDTVTVVGGSTCSKRITMGAVASGIPINRSIDPGITRVNEEKKNDDASILAYPNPVKAGGVLNLTFAEADKIPVAIQLLTVTGQRLMYKALNSKDSKTSIQLPSNLTAGVYYVQIQFIDGSIDKSTVLVSR